MYDRILTAIDFSEPSVDALRWTVRRFPDAEITLFHASEQAPPRAYLERALGEEPDIARERALDASANLEHLAEECGIPPRILVREGWPPREVERAASEIGARLIVVGAHTRRILPWDAPGATASKIVGEASRPVIVWRRRPRPPHPENRTVLAALDLRTGGEPLGPAVAEAAAFFGARLVLLHVLPRTLQAYLRAVSTPTKAQEVLQQVTRVAREELLNQIPAEYRERLEIQPIVARGRPITQILARAENEAADLIVIGQRHVPTGASRALLGSVTGSLLRGANCSVLVLPT